MGSLYGIYVEILYRNYIRLLYRSYTGFVWEAYVGNTEVIVLISPLKYSLSLFVRRRSSLCKKIFKSS